MSLEELTKDWDSINESSNKIEISDEQINRILKLKYRSFINKILIVEILIPIVCLYFIVLIIFRFDELGEAYLEILGGISILILGLLFILRMAKLIDTFRNRFFKYSHIIALEKIAKRNVELHRFYLINIILGFLLTILLIILTIKIYNEYDLIQSQYFWLIIIPSTLVFIVFTNNWIKKYYMNVVSETEDLLEELK